MADSFKRIREDRDRMIQEREAQCPAENEGRRTMTTTTPATHSTVTRYRHSAPETHGHCSYMEALGFAQSRERVNGPGNVSITIYRLEGGRDRWIETLGGVR